MRTTRKMKQTGFIFSVFNNTRDRLLNSIAHDELIKYMIMHDIAHKPISINDAKLGFYVEPNNLTSEKELEEFVKYHAIQNKQTSYYKIDENREVLKVNFSDFLNDVQLGKIKSVVKDELGDEYFFCPTMNEYFVIRR